MTKRKHSRKRVAWLNRIKRDRQARKANRAAKEAAINAAARRAIALAVLWTKWELGNV